VRPSALLPLPAPPQSASGALALPGAAADLRVLAERCVRDRVERFVERAQLAAHVQETLLRLEPLIDPLELLDDPVESLEERVDLAISQIPAVHEAIVRGEDVGACVAGRSTELEPLEQRTP
jgi:hypothetical protein